MTVKIRRVGTSDVLTVPKSIKKRYKEYEVYQDRNGAIVYMPKRNNPFKNSEFIAKHLYDGDDTGFIDGEELYVTPIAAKYVDTIPTVLFNDEKKAPVAE